MRVAQSGRDHGVDASVLGAALVDNGAAGRWAKSIIYHMSLAGPNLVLAGVSNMLPRLGRAGQISRSVILGSRSGVLGLPCAWRRRSPKRRDLSWTSALASGSPVVFS